MVACIYCGEPAGGLFWLHRECRRRHADALEQIPAFFPRALDSDMPASGFGNLSRQIARSGFVKDKELRRAVEEGLSRLLMAAAETPNLTPAQLARIYEIAAEFGLTLEDVRRVAARRDAGQRKNGLTARS
ncbi:MAG: hypothetical protein QOD74_2744 [Variibacter sp.]|nr:hypothetical protein [Variibacter sp.]